MNEEKTEKEQFIELRAKGVSFDKIAAMLRKGKQTLIDWSKELEGEIANRKGEELEAMGEKYFLLKQQRLQIRGEWLQRLRAEMESRQLSEIPTHKLLDMIGKFETLCSGDFVEPHFQSSREITEAKQESELWMH